MGQISRGVQDIPIKSIVGSVGRVTDFTRMFLPRQDDDANRWARVKLAMTDSVGLPPIEVYQIDQVYFVLDGNHRVSVARELGATHIQAYVTEVLTDVALSPDDKPDDLILKAEYADFLHRTGIHVLHPESDLRASVPGQYHKLEEHIAVHRYYMGLEKKQAISQEEAVSHWYDDVYMPVIRVVRELGVLASFPGRTETDLYIWLMEYRAALADQTGIEASIVPIAQDLVKRYSPTRQNRLERVGRRLMHIVAPKVLIDGPEPGLLRQRTHARLQDVLFADVLCAIDGSDRSWHSLKWLTQFIHSDETKLHGLHILRDQSKKNKELAQRIQTQFNQQLEEAGVTGELVILNGEIASIILDRARWMDLVSISLSYPYEPDPRSRIESGLRAIIRRSPTPVLAIPDRDFRLNRLLLAYDDSPKSKEALFVATYLAGTCDTCLDVLTAAPSLHSADEALQYAKDYLEESKVKASFIREETPAGDAILRVAEDRQADMVIMGGYGFGPVAELALGSVVDEVLRSRQYPVLVCQ
jgi:nucleotide-binding universal stress UspA family protein